jgi:hypothetical protein
MTQQNKRYEFDGFTFGSDGDIVLEISTAKNHSGYTTRYAIELSSKEIVQLITFLQEINDKGAN